MKVHSWKAFREKLLAGNPVLKAEYDRVGPRDAAMSTRIKARAAPEVKGSLR